MYFLLAIYHFLQINLEQLILKFKLLLNLLDIQNNYFKRSIFLTRYVFYILTMQCNLLILADSLYNILWWSNKYTHTPPQKIISPPSIYLLNKRLTGYLGCSFIFYFLFSFIFFIFVLLGSDLQKYGGFEEDFWNPWSNADEKRQVFCGTEGSQLG